MTITDAAVRKMPTDEEFKALLAWYGIGPLAAPTIGRVLTTFIAKKWNIVLVEEKKND